MVEITGQYTKRLAEYAATLRYDDIPSDVVAHVKRIVLNQLSAALWGWRIDSGQQVYSVLGDLGGREEAVVVGARGKLPAPTAAAVNATLAWASMNDDTHVESQLHSGHATVQPALAEGEARGISGRDLITAIVAGNEVGIRIAYAVGPAQDQKFNSSALGWWSELRSAFCAAIAGAKVLALDAVQTAHVLGIAATSTSGLYSSGMSSPHCGSVYPWDGAKSVLMGLLAARLAAAGMTDGPAPLEDEKGWVRVHTWGHGRLECLTDGLGDVFETARITPKTRCNSSMVHLPIDAANALVVEHDITAAQVERVVVRGQAWLSEYLWRLDVASYQDAILSLPYSIAMVILEPGPMTYPDQVLRYLGSPPMSELLGRFELAVEPSMTLAAQMPATVIIRTKDGRAYEKHSGTSARGNYPENPLAPGEIERKFKCAGAGILADDQVDEVIELIDRLEHLDRIDQLAHALRKR